MKKQKILTAAQHQEIYDLYWDENYSQKELTEKYGLSDNTGHISRIVNGQAFPRQRGILLKKYEYELNYTPSPQEPKQATVLRAKRTKLPSTKLTLTKATKIRKTWFSGEQTQQQLAKKYGINQSTVSGIILGFNWKREK